MGTPFSSPRTSASLPRASISRIPGLCEVELAVVGPDALQYFRLPSGEHVPIVRDLYGSMEPGGSQLAFVAPVAGEYRIRVRNIDPLQAPCTGYQMAVVRGV